MMLFLLLQSPSYKITANRRGIYMQISTYNGD
jgi:hypothetical protein